MTELRYLPDDDSTTEFTATVEDADGDGIVLDGTYFYPEGGGQPADHGTLEWDGGSAAVVDVRKDHGDVVHVVEAVEGALPDAGDEVRGSIDAERRETHRRMHTAQHVLSKVVLDEYGAGTAGNQIYADRSRIDFEPADLSDADLADIEREANRVIDADVPVEKVNMARDRAEAETPEGRGLFDLIPDSVDPLRMVKIGDIDLCPCGGTHVDSTGEIGHIRITDTVSKGKDVQRVEFELEPVS